MSQEHVESRYIVHELIGQGGMADVYRAEDTILHRHVAIKILRSNLAEDSLHVKRFEREASASATLAHKNIVDIYDVGQKHGSHYIVMELVTGQTLKELIHKRGALHVIEALDIMKQVLLGTGHAHHHGIIHRDLKPQNILVTDSGQAKIADFGIASIQSLSQVTKSDTIMGSLHYLAPEVVRGEKATSQSDIYSLGIVLYELLRGDVPFKGEVPVNIALKHMREDIPSIREFNPTIPQSLENVIIKATAKNLNDRYQTCEEMLADLETCLARKNEEKLVFAFVDDSEPTIIATPPKEDKYIEEDDEDEDKEKLKKNLKTVAYVLMALASVAIMILLYFGLYTPKQKMAVVPNMLGMTVEQAKAELEKNELVAMEFVQYKASSDYGKDLVMDCDPGLNKEVSKGTKVKLIVSAGPMIEIKDYVGKELDDNIKKELSDLGLTLKIEEEESDEKPGTIILQNRDPGTKIDPTSTYKEIKFTISKGLNIKVPNVVNMNINEAKRQLESMGFVVSLEVLAPPTSRDEILQVAGRLNRVITQSIEAYTEITKYEEHIILTYYDSVPDLPPLDDSDTDSNIPDDSTDQPGDDDTMIE